MILFALANYESMAQQLVAEVPNCAVGQFKIQRFANHELYILVDSKLSGQSCIVVGSVAPPDEQLLSFLLLAHTLTKEGAKKIVALMPYLAYARQHRDRPGESVAVPWVGSLLAASGIDKLVAIDVHNIAMQPHFSIPLISLTATPLLAQALQKKQHLKKDVTVVAPDAGAVTQAQALKNQLKLASPLVRFSKTRTHAGIMHLGSDRYVTTSALIIDDMIDTGSTLISCCQELKQQKVNDITIAVTHGLFTGNTWRELFSLGVSKIYCTDTVPLRPELLNEKRIVVIPVVTSLFINYLK